MGTRTDAMTATPPTVAPRGHHERTELADRKVNRVNTQREFFYATPGEVRAILERVAGQHLLEYHETPEAIEWRASGRKARVNPPVSMDTGSQTNGHEVVVPA
jgi:hypothetical protein